MASKKKNDDLSDAAKARMAMVAKAKAAIQKSTKQKPLEPTVETMAHVPTGSFALDMLIGGSPTKDGKGMICPGLPKRRIVEIYGPESSGKTTLLISAMVQAQKAGGAAMFIDFEHSLDHSYAKAQGLSYDEDKLLVYQPDSMEEGFKMMFVGIVSGFDIIGVDSVAAMVPKTELEKGFDDAAKIGVVARMFSQSLPKFAMWLHKYPKLDKEKTDPNHEGSTLVFINQTRAQINTSGYGGDNETTSGGKALKFYASLRLRTTRIRSEFVEKKDQMSGKKRRFPYGNVTDVKIIKSKIDAVQGHSTQMFIRFGLGVDDHFSIIETGVAQKVIKREGAYYALGENKFQGKEKFRSFLLENPKVYDALKVKLAEAITAAVSDGPIKIEDEDDVLDDFDFEGAGLDEDLDTEDVTMDEESAA